MKRYVHLLALCLATLPIVAAAKPRYTVQKTTEHGVEIVRLADTEREVQVSVVPSFGNRAYELAVHGTNLLYFPFADAAALEQSAAPGLNGIPFLAPWANRISGGGFWANDKRYVFNPDLGSLRLSPGSIAIHGMLTSSPLWEVVDAGADASSAHVTSRLQFWKYPDLMANWPFAHEYRMSYILKNGELEMITRVTSLSAQSMPIAVGFHPYLNLPGVARTELTIHIPARKHVTANDQMIPTGEMTANVLPNRIPLKDHTFDDGFTDLIRDSKGLATFTVQTDFKKIDVVYGPKYRAAVVFAPPARDFVCFEPMTAITNGVNLAHEGKYSDLQTLAPGATWEESFWIRFDGF